MGKYQLHFSEDPVIYTACLFNESPGMEPIIGTHVRATLFFSPTPQENPNAPYKSTAAF